jgi:C1A family cysteine protease
MGIPIHSNWNRQAELIPIPTTTATFQGGHAVCITGYDDSKYTGSFLIRNSWGTSVGDGGYFWLDGSSI